MDQKNWKTKYVDLLKEDQELRDEIQNLNFQLAKAKQLASKYQNLVLQLEQELNLQTTGRESLKPLVRRLPERSFENFFILNGSEKEIMYQFPAVCHFNSQILLDFAYPGRHSVGTKDAPDKRGPNTFIFT